MSKHRTILCPAECLIITELYEQGKTYNEIGQKLGKTYLYVKNIINKLGLAKNSNRSRKWSDEEINLLKEKYPITTNKELLELFPNRNFSGIREKVKFYKLNKIDYNHGKGVINCEKKLARLLSEEFETYYWMGFILADGSFKGNYLNIGIIKDDDGHLTKYKNFMGIPNALRYHENMVSCSIGDILNIKPIMDKFGLVYNKTYNPPDISVLEKLDWDKLVCMMIGFIDGDGNIYQLSKNSFNIRVVNHLSWKEFHNFMLRIMFGFFDVIYTGNNQSDARKKVDGDYRIYSTSNICSIELNKRLVEFIVGTRIPYLERKWGKMIEIYHNKDISSSTKIVIDSDKLYELHITEDMNPREISEILGITESTIYNRLIELGIYKAVHMKKAELYESLVVDYNNGISMETLVDKYSLTIDNIKEFLKKSGLSNDPKNDITANKLYELYNVGRLSCSRIALMYNTTESSIRGMVRKFGIKKEDVISAEILTQYYREDDKSISDIAEIFGGEPSVIRSKLKNNKISKKPKSDLIDKPTLEKYYIEDNMSVIELANLLGVTKNDIGYVIKLYCLKKPEVASKYFSNKSTTIYKLDNENNVVATYKSVHETIKCEKLVAGTFSLYKNTGKLYKNHIWVDKNHYNEIYNK